MMSLSKDLLQYFDEHFMEKPDRYARMTQIWSDIIRDMRSSNMPLIVMKSGLFNALSKSK